jgi:uncharacterized membrane protein
MIMMMMMIIIIIIIIIIIHTLAGRARPLLRYEFSRPLGRPWPAGYRI